MRVPKLAVVLAVMAVGAVLAMHSTMLAQSPSNLRIVSPPNGAKLSTDFVNVRFQLLNPAVSGAGSPTFQLQLDGGDPVQTASSDYTFTGLAPGTHTVVVQLVDANNTPIAGSVNAVQFVVLQPSQPKSSSPPSVEQSASVNLQPPDAEPSGGAQPQVETTALQQQPAPDQHQPAQSPNPSLPDSGSALPLLSVIGFGVLLGGIASALKTR